ncbi:SprT family zinc-dependent metalloprotease [Pseudanabaena galeata UHCC 0370]|uniref:SprT family zinc-dependent metalloprotease n=1 Tax=Pseudanabaena galeata UHCC 0370 TaxID=3110310 RepID=A0ABU5TDM4_9CYAN|nr:SprT family zinc-dependent metalloprotease [Pseudanabaena galeata]MEA5476377.1 SprT family zinc-dependent metalloprotease [Pseudanabaena galeata UHCC 0370]
MASGSKSLTSNDDLPAYTVRVSDRAKSVRISLSVEAGLEVVIPADYDHHKVPELIQKKRDWIARNQLKLDQREAFFQSQAPHELPDRINLRSLGEEWQIEYQQVSTKSRVIAIQEKKSELKLVVKGNITDIEACKFFLKQWLMQKAEKHLFSWLRKVSTHAKLPYRTTAVRSQKTLWGSCSGNRNISLNYKLLFLEANVVEYVLIHELCHTVHMNHSDKFWKLVSKFEPNYKILDKSLNQAWQIIPAWLDF